MADQAGDKARLWKFCNRSSPEGAAWTITDARERPEELDSWTAGESRRRR